ncbi:UNVERIFIED_CONTAM: hypothetical protein FKN15_047368 [Acipenser sinensis]
MQKRMCEKPEAQAESCVSADKDQDLPSTSSSLTRVSLQPSSVPETALINCTPPPATTTALHTDSKPPHAFLSQLQNSPEAPEIAKHNSDIQPYSNSHDAPLQSNSSSQSSLQGIFQLCTKTKDTFQTLHITFNSRDELQPVQSNSNSQDAPLNTHVSDSNSQDVFQGLELSSSFPNMLPTLQLDPDSQSAPVDIPYNPHNEAQYTQLDSISQSANQDTQLDLNSQSATQEMHLGSNSQTALSTLQQTLFDAHLTLQQDSNSQDAPPTLQPDSISLTPQQDPASQDAPLGLQSNSTPQEEATAPNLETSNSHHALAVTHTDEVGDSVLSILNSAEVSALLEEVLVPFSPEPTILQLLESVLVSEAIDSTDCPEILLGPCTNIPTQETTLMPPGTFEIQADPELSSTEAMEPVQHPESDQEGQTSTLSLEGGLQTPCKAPVACLLDDNNQASSGNLELQQLSSGGAEMESSQTPQLNQESALLQPDQGELASSLKGEPAGEPNQDVIAFGKSQTFTLTEQSASESTVDGKIGEKDRDGSPLGDSPPKEFIIRPPNSLCSSPTAIEPNANPETVQKDHSQMSQDNLDLANQMVLLAAPFLEDLAKRDNVDFPLSPVMDSNLVQEKDHSVLQVCQDEADRSSTNDPVSPNLFFKNPNKVCQEDLLKNSSVSSDSDALCVKDQNTSPSDNSQEKMGKGGSKDPGMPDAYLFNLRYICKDTVGKYPDFSVVLTVGEKLASDHDKEHRSDVEMSEDGDPSEGNMERKGDMTQGVPDSDIQVKSEARSCEGKSKQMVSEASGGSLEDQKVPTLVEARPPVKLIGRCCCHKTRTTSALCSLDSQSGSLNPDPSLSIGEANQLSNTRGAKTKLKRGRPMKQDKQSSHSDETQHPTQPAEESISELTSEQLPKKLKWQRRGRRRKIPSPDLRQVSDPIAGEDSIQSGFTERDLEGSQLESDPGLGEENRQGCTAMDSGEKAVFGEDVPRCCGRKRRTSLVKELKRPGKGRCLGTFREFRNYESITSPNTLEANSSLAEMPLQSEASGSTENKATRSNQDEESDNVPALTVSRSQRRRSKQSNAIPVRARITTRRQHSDYDSIAARTTKRRKKN